MPSLTGRAWAFSKCRKSVRVLAACAEGALLAGQRPAACQPCTLHSHLGRPAGAVMKNLGLKIDESELNALVSDYDHSKKGEEGGACLSGTVRERADGRCRRG